MTTLPLDTMTNMNLIQKWVCDLSTLCVFQLPHYASLASVYQQETGSPAPAIASNPGVTSKVSAWLQQTHDSDATSNGQNHLWLLAME